MFYPPPAEAEVFPTEIKLNSKSEDLSIKNTGQFLHKGEERRVRSTFLFAWLRSVVPEHA
jgi:hypothetical protein